MVYKLDYSLERERIRTHKNVNISTFSVEAQRNSLCNIFREI